ncbi:MAG: ABC transporter permease [Planctomycetota bacterium]|nr:ABC transporter permease [Planctomycetota bacterium]
MIRFIIWRVVQLPLVLVVIYLITFGLVWLAPGDPFGNTERKLDPAAQKELENRFHANSWESFLKYYPQQILKRGDLGPSLSYPGWSVNDVLKYSFPVSMTLGLFAMGIAVVIGCVVGVTASLHQKGLLDFFSLTIALIGISLPSFVVAGLLLVVFSDWFHLLPSGGWGTFSRMILPGIALALMPMAYIARLTRVSMLDTLGNDFVRTARAKGLSRQKVIWKHAFSNAFLPVFTYLGPATAYAITGSFVVETVFNIPGLGVHFVNGVKNRDQTLILGTVLVYAAVLLTLNLIVDIGYALIDPRIDVTARSNNN